MTYRIFIVTRANWVVAWFWPVHAQYAFATFQLDTCGLILEPFGD